MKLKQSGNVLKMQYENGHSEPFAVCSDEKTAELVWQTLNSLHEFYFADAKIRQSQIFEYYENKPIAATTRKSSENY